MSEKQDELLVGIDEKLQSLIQLMAMSISQAGGTLADKARRLQKAGMTPKDIAALLDSTPNAVSVQLSKVKRNAKNGKKAAKKK